MFNNTNSSSILFGIGIAVAAKFGIFAGVILCIAVVVWLVHTRKQGWLKRTIIGSTIVGVLTLGVLFGLYGVIVAILLGCIAAAIARIMWPEEFEKYSKQALSASERVYGSAKADAQKRWADMVKRFKEDKAEQAK